MNTATSANTLAAAAVATFVPKNGRNDAEMTTHIEIGEGKGYDGETGTRVLTITTEKDSFKAGISTEARVSLHIPQGGWTSVQHCFGLGGGGDFTRKLATLPGVRATEKNLRALHAKAVEDFGLPLLIGAAQLFYQQKDAADAAQAAQRAAARNNTQGGAHHA